MNRARKFLRLDAQDQRLLLRTLWWLGAVKCGLWLMPFQALHRLLGRMTRATRRAPEADWAAIERVGWAIAVAGEQIPPFKNCLAQALASQVLFGRLGQPTTLRIGVARGAEGQLQAHAWVESQGRVIIGGLDELSRFTPLPPLEG